MNNNIQEDYCSFEVSRLLKEKKFEISTLNYYLVRTMVQRSELYTGNWNGHPETISCPSHALAIKWIRENFGIHICLYYHTHDMKYQYTIDLDTISGIRKGYSIDNGIQFNSPEAATEAALLYTLQNLIK